MYLSPDETQARARAIELINVAKTREAGLGGAAVAAAILFGAELLAQRVEDVGRDLVASITR
jgi:hypothetical protein